MFYINYNIVEKNCCFCFGIMFVLSDFCFAFFAFGSCGLMIFMLEYCLFFVVANVYLICSRLCLLFVYRLATCSWVLLFLLVNTFVRLIPLLIFVSGVHSSISKALNFPTFGWLFVSRVCVSLKLLLIFPPLYQENVFLRIIILSHLAFDPLLKLCLSKKWMRILQARKNL